MSHKNQTCGVEDHEVRPKFLAIADVVAINKRFDDGAILDMGALRSAVSEPQQGAFGIYFHPTLVQQGSALLRGLAHNHSFVAANKRTAVASTLAFFNENGVYVNIDSGSLLGLATDAATGKADLMIITGVLEQGLEPKLTRPLQVLEL